MTPNIIEALSEYVELKRNGTEYSGRCPFHDDHNPSLYVNPEKNAWICFGCGAKGRGAESFLKRLGQPVVVTRATRPQRREEPQLNMRAVHNQYIFNMDPQRLGRMALELGVKADALRAMEVGWDGYAGYTFPMRSPSGAITGIRHRSLEGTRKWSTRQSKRGLFIPTMEISNCLTYVCEGPTDTAAAVSMGLHAIGLPSCKSCLKECVQWLKGRRRFNVCVVADDDEAGMEGARGLAALTTRAGITTRVIVTPKKDIREWMRAGATAASVQALVDMSKVLRR